MNNNKRYLVTAKTEASDTIGKEIFLAHNNRIYPVQIEELVSFLVKCTVCEQKDNEIISRIIPGVLTTFSTPGIRRQATFHFVCAREILGPLPLLFHRIKALESLR